MEAARRAGKPRAFTERGVAMLSSVLGASRRAPVSAGRTVSQAARYCAVGARDFSSSNQFNTIVIEVAASVAVAVIANRWPSADGW